MGSLGTQSFWQPLKQHFWSSVQSLSRRHSSPLKSQTPSCPFDGAGHRPGLSMKGEILFDVFIKKMTLRWQTNKNFIYKDWDFLILVDKETGEPTYNTLRSKWPGQPCSWYFFSFTVHTVSIFPILLNRLKFAISRAAWDKTSWQVFSQRFKVRLLTFSRIGSFIKSNEHNIDYCRT